MRSAAIILLAVSSLAGAEGKPARKAVEVSISAPRGVSHGSALRLFLTQTGAVLTCGTEAVPTHEVKVVGLKGLNPPFQPAVSTAHCERVIRWGAESACYERGANRVLEELIRRCLHI
ncbi:MAG: hypothetical protein NDJ89_10125 [Oligoflexia bacterium]|nr:hypothetical protein [Oligoflexia bacterium]